MYWKISSASWYLKHHIIIKVYDVIKMKEVEFAETKYFGIYMFTSFLLLLILGTRLATSVYKAVLTQIHITETAGYLNSAQLYFGHSRLLEIWVYRGSTNMAFLHFLYAILIIAEVSKECYSLSANIRNDLNKRFEKLEKQISLELKKMQKENQYLQKEIQVLQQKTNINFEHCRLQPDDICGPCLCRDDERLLKKYYCNCQNLQAKWDCLEHNKVGRKINGIYKIHQNILKIIQVYCDQTTDGGGWTVFQRRIDGSVNFFRDWKHYKEGFGNLQNEFWLANEDIFTLTLQGLYPRGNELRIDLTNAKKIKHYVKYANFHIR